jgi:hypothetical protein
MLLSKKTKVWLSGNKEKYINYLKTAKLNSVTEYKTSEKEWGLEVLNEFAKNGKCRITKTDTVQWSSNVGECLIRVLLENRGDKVWKPKKKTDKDGCGLQPDLETKDFIYEVKTRNYFTSGTAGEKVLGTPYKYCNVPTLYGKPLVIVLVGYQEYEYKKLVLQTDALAEKRKKMLDFWKDEFQITFIGASSLL